MPSPFFCDALPHDAGFEPGETTPAQDLPDVHGDLPLAPWRLRDQAAVLDAVFSLLAAVVLLPGYLLATWLGFDLSPAWYVFGVAAAYHLLSSAILRTTMGKAWNGFEPRNAHTLDHIGRTRVVVRSLPVAAIFLLAAWTGAFYALPLAWVAISLVVIRFHPEGRSPADLIARTVVVQVPELQPIAVIANADLSDEEDAKFAPQIARIRARSDHA